MSRTSWVLPEICLKLPLLKPVSDYYGFDWFFKDNELTVKWLNRLRATANNNESREQHSQLSSILDYYNRHSQGTQNLEAINWDSYAADIHTPNVVKAMQAKYKDFMAAEYSVDGAVGKLGTRSEAMKSLDVAMHYNYNLWMVHYLMHLDSIETLHNIGDVNMLEIGRASCRERV